MAAITEVRMPIMPMPMMAAKQTTDNNIGTRLTFKRDGVWKPETNTIHLLGRRNRTNMVKIDLRHQRMSQLIFNSLHHEI